MEVKSPNKEVGFTVPFYGLTPNEVTILIRRNVMKYPAIERDQNAYRQGYQTGYMAGLRKKKTKD